MTCEPHTAGPLTGREAFFAEYAGVGFSPDLETFEQGQRRGARELASAEAWLRRQPDLHTLINSDPEPWNGDVPYDGPLYVLSIWRDAYPEGSGHECVAALGSVAAEGHDDPYVLVCFAEMADEIRSETAT